MLQLLSQILSIVVIDLVLSGDNALVIGMAARRLNARQRRSAIIVGGAGAIALRIVFTIAAALLLNVPFLEAVGGLLLVWIAYKLLNGETDTHDIQAGESFASAVKTIILADLVMSLDNMLAVGGAAHGSIELLLFGLALSMPLILFGSSVIARLLNRLPWLMIIGSAVLTITAARMIVDDHLVAEAIGDALHGLALGIVAVVLTAAVLIPTVVRWRRERAERLTSGIRTTESPSTPD